MSRSSRQDQGHRSKNVIKRNKIRTFSPMVCLNSIKSGYRFGHLVTVAADGES